MAKRNMWNKLSDHLFGMDTDGKIINIPIATFNGLSQNATGAPSATAALTAVAQIPFAGIEGAITAGNTDYVGPVDNAEKTSDDRFALITTAGTVTKTYGFVGTAPAAGETVVVTLMKNAAATANTFTISGTGTTGNDTANTIAVAAGDQLSFRAVASNSGSFAAADLALGLEFQSTAGTGVTPTTTHTHAIQSSGAGNPSITELGTTGLSGLQIDAAGDDIRHIMPLPHDFDARYPLNIRVLWSSDQTTTTDTVTWKCLFDRIVPEGSSGAAIAPATALDTALVADTNLSTANAIQTTAWGTINGGTFTSTGGDSIAFLIELDAVSGADPATDAIIVWSVQLRYTQLFI